MMSENDGQGHSLKIFQGAKIEIFGPAHMPTGIKGATDQMLPRKVSNGTKALPTYITHNNMTFWPALGSYKYPERPKKALLGALEVLGGPWRSSEGPRALIWSQLPLAGPTGWVTPISSALAP